MTRERGQTSLVGVALLLAITVASLGVLTAAAGTTVERGANAVAAERVADDLSRLVDADGVGGGRTRVSLLGGDLRSVNRTIRVLDSEGAVVAAVDVDGLVREAGRRRVAAVGGGVVVSAGADAWFHTSPRLSAADGELLLSVTALDAAELGGVGGDRTEIELRTESRRDRRRLAPDAYAVAVETRTPDPWRRHFEREGATVDRRDFDGDGTPSVVARYADERRLHLLVRHLRVEVTRG